MARPDDGVMLSERACAMSMGRVRSIPMGSPIEHLNLHGMHGPIPDGIRD